MVSSGLDKFMQDGSLSQRSVINILSLFTVTSSPTFKSAMSLGRGLSSISALIGSTTFLSRLHQSLVARETLKVVLRRTWYGVFQEFWIMLMHQDHPHASLAAQIQTVLYVMRFRLRTH